MGYFLLVALFVSVIGFNSYVHCQRPASVNIGAIFTYNSVIGRVAKLAMEVAIDDINADSKVLGGTELKLIMADANCNAYIGAIDDFQLLDNGVVAIIGPQSSTVAHLISNVATGLQVPLISFAATDPSLSSLQYPFFFRSTQSDSHQMDAIADFVDFYGWRQVISIYVDNDYGRNGLAALDDALANKMVKIYHKIPLSIGVGDNIIMDLLNKSTLAGPKVYIVHASPDSGLAIFSVAEKLQMMSNGYVWLATDWLCASIDSSQSLDHRTLDFLQGVVAFRQYIPETIQKKAFVYRWGELYRKGNASSFLNTYGFCAYDAIWAIAHALNEFLNASGNISFSLNNRIHDLQGSVLSIGSLKTFDGGQLLLQKLSQTNFTGLTGPVMFDSDRNLVNVTYEIVNIDKMMIRRVGFWSNHLGLSVLPPETLHGKSKNFSNQELGGITWPGGVTEKPRGWGVPYNGRPLRIGVPNRASYIEFATKINGSNRVEGYCIDVFKAALELIPYAVPHTFIPFGNGRANPNYDELVDMVAKNVFDAAVGDIAIVRNRTKNVDFTQPYTATGLVIVAPARHTKSSPWAFLEPFSTEMWCVTGVFFFFVGGVIWLLEHRKNNDFRGSPRRQILTVFLFSFSTLFKSQNEKTVSTLGRVVMVIWMFLLLVVTSSYTANLTSILTVQQLASPIQGIDSLIASREPIGYQVGSFSRSYMIDSLNIPQSRLISLSSPEDYDRALNLGPTNGGVGAIVDELPYVELFLSGQTEFSIVGQMFTKSGWGFAFQRGSPLAVDMSTAILKLSENGKLQKIHNKWFCRALCVSESKSQFDNRLHLTSFGGLFMICGGCTFVALLVFLIRMVRQYASYSRREVELSPVTDFSRSSCSQSFSNFIAFIDEKEEAIKNKLNEYAHNQMIS